MIFNSYEKMLWHMTELRPKRRLSEEGRKKLSRGELELPTNETQTRSGPVAHREFGVMFRHDMTYSSHFPAVTSKRLFFRGVVEELAWMLRGSTNVNELKAVGVHIWDAWADDQGQIGPGYGAMWRAFPGPDGPVDQIKNLVEGIKNDPYSRRHMVMAWNPALVKYCRLPPCHYGFQVSITSKFGLQPDTLNLMWSQRSADLFVGLPFNIASYGLLMHLLAKVTGYKPGVLVGSIGDLHLYKEHEEAAIEQLSRDIPTLPKLGLSDRIDKDFDLSTLKGEDAWLVDYHPHEAIKVTVPV